MILNRMLIGLVRLPPFVRGDPAGVERDDALGREDRLGSMRHHDPRHAHRPQGLVDRPLARDVEMARRLVEEQRSRARGRARGRAAPAASARPRARCPCRRSASRSPSASRRCRHAPPPPGRRPRSARGRRPAAKKAMLSAIEPANRLSSCSTTPIIARQASGPSRASGSPLTRIVPARRLEQSGEELQKRGLAAPGGAGDRDRLARLDAEAHAARGRRARPARSGRRGPAPRSPRPSRCGVAHGCDCGSGAVSAMSASRSA